MTIRNRTHYDESIWDWGPFDKCFGDTHIRISDIDGIAERHGHFLVIETKRPGVPVPIGQQRMFDEMAATGLFCILTIWGWPGEPERVQIQTVKGMSEPQEMTLEDVQGLVETWFRWADKR